MFYLVSVHSLTATSFGSASVHYNDDSVTHLLCIALLPEGQPTIAGGGTFAGSGLLRAQGMLISSLVREIHASSKYSPSRPYSQKRAYT